jgi:hypothetical protein
MQILLSCLTVLSWPSAHLPAFVALWRAPQGVEWPVANQSKLTLEFLAVEVAEAAIANEQPHTSPALRTALSGGRLASSGSLPRQASKLGPAAEKAVTEAVTDAAAVKSSGQPAAAAAAEGAARPSILDRLGSGPKEPDDASTPAEAAEAPAAAAAAQKKRQRVEQEEEEEVVTLDTLFRKTAAKPHLYFLPLTDEQVAAKRARREAAAAAGGGGVSSGRVIGSQPVGPAVMEGL